MLCWSQWTEYERGFGLFPGFVCAVLQTCGAPEPSPLGGGLQQVAALRLGHGALESPGMRTAGRGAPFTGKRSE